MRSFCGFDIVHFSHDFIFQLYRHVSAAVCWCSNFAIFPFSQTLIICLRKCMGAFFGLCRNMIFKCRLNTIPLWLLTKFYRTFWTWTSVVTVAWSRIENPRVQINPTKIAFSKVLTMQAYILRHVFLNLWHQFSTRLKFFHLSFFGRLYQNH